MNAVIHSRIHSNRCMHLQCRYLPAVFGSHRTDPDDVWSRTSTSSQGLNWVQAPKIDRFLLVSVEDEYWRWKATWRPVDCDGSCTQTNDSTAGNSCWQQNDMYRLVAADKWHGLEGGRPAGAGPWAGLRIVSSPQPGTASVPGARTPAVRSLPFSL